MNPETIYDIIGIGIGPFNLGLAALCDEIPELNCIFFDDSPELNWHPGMMLDTARMQVPFFADLVTIASPRSKFTFINYLWEEQRLHKFANHENNFPFRKQYNRYLKWVASCLNSLQFNTRVTAVHFDESTSLHSVEVFSASGKKTNFFTKHIVLGIGTKPSFPKCVENIDHPYIIHSSEYLVHKKALLEKPSITIIGSGQSAAEIFHDLLQSENEIQLSWFTRSERFYPMEYSKLTLEMTSLEFIDYFFSLKPDKKRHLLKMHDSVYKGINFSLIGEIYDTLYLKDLDGTPPVIIQANTELINVQAYDSDLTLTLYHTGLEEQFSQSTSALILATGYIERVPFFLQSIKDRLNWFNEKQFQVARNYSIDKTGKQVFVQNAELNTHGFSAPDLGMGPYRNATILNTILGYDHFKLEKKTAFQTFGIHDFKELQNY